MKIRSLDLQFSFAFVYTWLYMRFHFEFANTRQTYFPLSSISNNTPITISDCWLIFFVSSSILYCNWYVLPSRMVKLDRIETWNISIILLLTAQVQRNYQELRLIRPKLIFSNILFIKLSLLMINFQWMCPVI